MQVHCWAVSAAKITLKLAPNLCQMAQQPRIELVLETAPGSVSCFITRSYMELGRRSSGINRRAWNAVWASSGLESTARNSKSPPCSHAGSCNMLLTLHHAPLRSSPTSSLRPDSGSMQTSAVRCSGGFGDLCGVDLGVAHK